jgi:hypothetical protein
MSDVIRRLTSDDPNDGNDRGGTGIVTNVAAGTTPDGRRLITILWRGALIDCAYLASYTPVQGHSVVFMKDGPVIFVLGKPATV